jgi:hypothetical protein
VHDFFSDREQGRGEPTELAISDRAWGGLWAAIQTRLADGSFGFRYPEKCPDGNAVAGCDDKAFFAALNGQVPDLGSSFGPGHSPATLAVLDALEFCHAAVAEPQQLDFHGYFKHHHLRFEQLPGQKAFRDEVNLVLARNGLMYKLRKDGRVQRLAPEPLGEALRDSRFNTGDDSLDDYLTAAVRKFLDPDPDVRIEALHELWDAWERFKSIEVPGNKLASVTKLVDRAAAGQPEVRTLLESEAKEVTRIGNDFQIRHTEVGKAAIVRDEDLDYLFHRGFALIRFVLRATGRGS